MTWRGPSLKPCANVVRALKLRRARIRKNLDEATSGPMRFSDRGIGEAQGWIQALDFAIAKMGGKP